MTDTVTYAPGNFGWVEKWEREMLEDMYAAVTAAEAWDFLREESPPADRGFMFWSHSRLTDIQSKMQLMDMHSGASYGCCMRVMEAIAKRGWNTYVRQTLETRARVAAMHDAAMAQLE